MLDNIKETGNPAYYKWNLFTNAYTAWRRLDRISRYGTKEHVRQAAKYSALVSVISGCGLLEEWMDWVYDTHGSNSYEVLRGQFNRKIHSALVSGA